MNHIVIIKEQNSIITRNINENNILAASNRNNEPSRYTYMLLY